MQDFGRCGGCGGRPTQVGLRICDGCAIACHEEPCQRDIVHYYVDDSGARKVRLVYQDCSHSKLLKESTMTIWLSIQSQMCDGPSSFTYCV